MNKWQCTKCDPYDPCFCDSGRTRIEPTRCPLVEGNKPHWEPIRNEDYGKPLIPDWIKVGEWVYLWDDAIYAKITEIETVGCSAPIIHFNNNTSRTYGALSWDNVSQARLHPYNAYEMKALVGKVLDRDGDRGLVLFYEDHTNKVYILGTWFSADIIMERYTIDGLPCGVLERFHEEKGEWVE